MTREELDACEQVARGSRAMAGAGVPKRTHASEEGAGHPFPHSRRARSAGTTRPHRFPQRGLDDLRCAPTACRPTFGVVVDDLDMEITHVIAATTT
jgi:hypothetical protein